MRTAKVTGRQELNTARIEYDNLRHEVMEAIIHLQHKRIAAAKVRSRIRTLERQINNTRPSRAPGDIPEEF